MKLAELVSAFQKDEPAASKQFGGKLIRTSGVVDSVSEKSQGGAFVTLGSGEPGETVRVLCSVEPDQKQKALALTKGQRVTVEGGVIGLMMDVALGGCAINPGS